METPDWYRQLTETFAVNGLVGSSLLSVLNAEQAAGGYLLKKYHGQNILLNSFQSFFIDTLTLANDQIKLKGWPKELAHYPVALVSISNLFRRFRACEILYSKGYPLDAYSLMRDVKDRTFMLTGVAHNFITFQQLIGAPDRRPADPKEYKKKLTRSRKDAESLITQRLMGLASGLPVDVQDDLKGWADLFHFEVHGGSLSLLAEITAIQRRSLPQIGPSVDEDGVLMYINRSSELGWLALRLLPFLQLSEGAFGMGWEQKMQVLDNSFRHMVEQFGVQGKKFGPSFITMADTNFQCKKPFYYFEADGSARQGDVKNHIGEIWE